MVLIEPADTVLPFFFPGEWQVDSWVIPGWCCMCTQPVCARSGTRRKGGNLLSSMNTSGFYSPYLEMYLLSLSSLEIAGTCTDGPLQRELHLEKLTAVFLKSS